MPKLLSPATRTSNRPRTAQRTPLRRPSGSLKRLTAPDAAPGRLTEPDEPLFRPQPHRRLPYRDVLAVWLINPMSADDLARLQGRCDGKLGVANRHARFNPEYCQRLTLRQPSRQALEILARRNDVMVNYEELAQDWIFQTRDELDAAFMFVLEHSLMKDRRGQSAKVCLGKKGPTSYSGPRWSANLAVAYADKKSKISNELHNLHQERRRAGAKSLRQKGMHTLRDHLALDETQFWQDNLEYWRIFDVEGLGRAYNNYLDKLENPQHKSRKKAKIIPWGKHGYNIDARMGHQLIRVLGLFKDEQITLRKNAKERAKTQYPGYYAIYAARSIQNIFDRLHKIIPHIGRYMKRISIDATLTPIDPQSAMLNELEGAIGDEACYIRGEHPKPRKPRN